MPPRTVKIGVRDLPLRDMISLGAWRMGLGCPGKILPSSSPSPPPPSPTRGWGGGGEVGEFEGAEPPQDSQGGFGGGAKPPPTRCQALAHVQALADVQVLPMNISEIAHEYIRNCFSRNQITKMRLKRIFVIWFLNKIIKHNVFS